MKWMIFIWMFEKLKEWYMENLTNICDWFFDNKLSIQMEMIKLKQHYLPINIHKSVISLNIVFDNVSNKKHPPASLLGCAFNDRLTGELMTLNVIKKAKFTLKHFDTSTQIMHALRGTPIHQQNKVYNKSYRLLEINKSHFI